jgi:hypothetical protein
MPASASEAYRALHDIEDDESDASSDSFSAISEYAIQAYHTLRDELARDESGGISRPGRWTAADFARFPDPDTLLNDESEADN